MVLKLGLGSGLPHHNSMQDKTYGKALGSDYAIPPCSPKQLKIVHQQKF
jgi:hypothetical protein